MSDNKVRKRYQIDKDTYARVEYWAAKYGMSPNEYVVDAIDDKIARENYDFDIPNALTGRADQIISLLESLSSDFTNFGEAMTSEISALTGLTRGDNYLLDVDEDVQ